MAGREEVSLSPHTVLASEVPLPGSRLALIAGNSLLFTSLAVRLGGAPDLLVYGLCTDNAVYSLVKLQRRTTKPQEDGFLQCVGVGKGHLLSAFQIFFYFFELLSNSTSGTIPKMSHIRLPVSVHKQ